MSTYFCTSLNLDIHSLIHLFSRCGIERFEFSKGSKFGFFFVFDTTLVYIHIFLVMTRRKSLLHSFVFVQRGVPRYPQIRIPQWAQLGSNGQKSLALKRSLKSPILWSLQDSNWDIIYYVFGFIIFYQNAYIRIHIMNHIFYSYEGK